MALAAPHEKTRERVFRNLAIALSKDPTGVVTPIDVLSMLVQMIETFGGLRGPEKKALVIRTFEDIVSGHDGVLGTDADLLPPDVVQGMRVMLESNLITSIIDVVCAATVGRVISGISLTAQLSFALCKCAQSCCEVLSSGFCCPASASASASAAVCRKAARAPDGADALTVSHNVARESAAGDADLDSTDALTAPLLQHIHIRPMHHPPCPISQAQQDRWVAACMTAPHTRSVLRRTQSLLPPRGRSPHPLSGRRWGGAADICRNQSAQSI